MKLRFMREARDETVAAAKWYEERERGLNAVSRMLLDVGRKPFIKSIGSIPSIIA